jgi:tRNA uridine 5-carboxymethylaminomethyl modification enzyme
MLHGRRRVRDVNRQQARHEQKGESCAASERNLKNSPVATRDEEHAYPRPKRVSPLIESVNFSSQEVMQTSPEYDVIVIGTGHAGCEAALAAARMGCRTAAFTLNLDTTALMPCNPSVGGPGKAHLVREIDALGGEMGRNTDRTSIQIRMLNTSKGPAVQALRAQSDKRAYAQSMKEVLESQPNLDVKQAAVDDIIIKTVDGLATASGVITSAGTRYHARTIVLTTGTFLKGRICIGDRTIPAGRAGEFPADNLSASLERCGFVLGRLKTGTPPRIDARSIDYGLTREQPGSDEPLFFSFDARRAFREGREASPTSRSPVASLREETGNSGSTWREQLSCHLVQTNEQTHEIIRSNLDRAPMFNGGITSVGPRYCPSIETKIVRFSEKPSHHLFLEPEGWHTRETYVQGANTSLPEDVQLEMLRSIPALRRCEIMRAGYAIEYDYLPGTQVSPTLESKPLKSLFLAGQIMGTTGYEEAGALGIIAGINAARRARNSPEVVLRRDQAYIGVLIDDLVTKRMDEPYRMHTSQAEFRLLLRQDNAEERLGELAEELGLVDEERACELAERRAAIARSVSSLGTAHLSLSRDNLRRLRDMDVSLAKRNVSARDLLARPGIGMEHLRKLGLVSETLSPEVEREVETAVKYDGYISRQEAEVQRLHRLEERAIPEHFDYDSVRGLRAETQERLQKVRPRTIGQASRIAGVTSSDVAVLLVRLEGERRHVAMS